MNRRQFVKTVAAFLATRPVFAVEPATAGAVTRKVALFAGHTTEKDKEGAISYFGVPEYQFNDQILKLLQSGDGTLYHKFYATQNIPLKDRPDKIYEVDAEVAISIHHDSMSQEARDNMAKENIASDRWAEYEGFSLQLDKYAEENDLVLAEIIAKEMIKAGFKPNLTHALRDPKRFETQTPEENKLGIYKQGLYFCRNAPVPAVIVECGCIASPREEARLIQPKTQRLIAATLDKAIADYLASS